MCIYVAPAVWDALLGGLLDISTSVGAPGLDPTRARVYKRGRNPLEQRAQGEISVLPLILCFSELARGESAPETKRRPDLEKEKTGMA